MAAARAGAVRRAPAALPALLGAWLLASPSCAAAKVLIVGPNEELKVPSAAAKIAADGDTIEIEPVAGGYFDCAIWTASHLTIEGSGDGVVVTDTTCQGKALFVISGNDVTIRNLTFQRARVPDRNGAGIREEGTNLRIESSRFVDNQSGILVASSPTGTLAIRDSEFTRNGRANGIDTGALALLRVEHCRFEDTTDGGVPIFSQAVKTELVGNELIEGEAGNSRYLVELPAGGALVMRDNVLDLGPQSAGADAAVLVMQPYGAPPVRELTFTGNRVRNDSARSLVFVRNWTAAQAQFQGNLLDAHTTPESSAGYLWFSTKSAIRLILGRATMVAKSTLSSPLVRSAAISVRDFAAAAKARLLR